MSKKYSQSTQSASSAYCYGQGYDAASGNYEPTTSETVAQGADVAFCKASGNSSSY